MYRSPNKFYSIITYFYILSLVTSEYLISILRVYTLYNYRVPGTSQAPFQGPF